MTAGGCNRPARRECASLADLNNDKFTITGQNNPER
jgi:hypothetical protein